MSKEIKEPKCKTCGGTGRYHNCNTWGCSSVDHINKAEPCPDCTEQPPAGECFPLTCKDMYEVIQGCCGLCPWCVGVLGRYIKQERDRSEAGERILEERIEKLSDTLDRSEASRKDLLTACRQAFNESRNPKVEKILKAAIAKEKEVKI